jgi:hypothetical protein
VPGWPGLKIEGCGRLLTVAPYGYSRSVVFYFLLPVWKLCLVFRLPHWPARPVEKDTQISTL